MIGIDFVALAHACADGIFGSKGRRYFTHAEYPYGWRQKWLLNQTGKGWQWAYDIWVLGIWVSNGPIALPTAVKINNRQRHSRRAHWKSIRYHFGIERYISSSQTMSTWAGTRDNVPKWIRPFIDDIPQFTGHSLSVMPLPMNVSQEQWTESNDVVFWLGAPLSAV